MAKISLTWFRAPTELKVGAYFFLVSKENQESRSTFSFDVQQMYGKPNNNPNFKSRAFSFRTFPELR